MKDHRGVFQSNSDVRLELLGVDLAVNIDDILLGATNLDEALFLAHHFADLTDLGVRLKQKIQFILEVLDHRVHFISLRLKSA